MSLGKPLLTLVFTGFAGIVATPMAFALQSTPVAAPNPVRGAQLFLQCRACHTVTSGAPNAVGPNLSGVFGAKAASRPDYPYSAALAKSGLTWNATTLDSFLTRPSKAVPGTRMGFAGVADAKARADIIAYLGTLKARK